jgi:hypothetical protein
MQLLLSLTTDAASPLPVTCLALSRSLRLLPTEQTLAAGDAEAGRERRLEVELSDTRERDRSTWRLRGRPTDLRAGDATAACCCWATSESHLRSITEHARS